jgi:hypothetical protein
MIPGHVGFEFILRNFVLANWNLPAIIFCSSLGPGWRVPSRIDVSVLAVGNRAFVFAASPHFVAGNCSTRCRGAVSVGAVSPAHGDASQKILRRFEARPDRANRQATEE